MLIVAFEARAGQPFSFTVNNVKQAILMQIAVFESTSFQSMKSRELKKEGYRFDLFAPSHSQEHECATSQAPPRILALATSIQHSTSNIQHSTSSRQSTAYQPDTKAIAQARFCLTEFVLV